MSPSWWQRRSTFAQNSIVGYSYVFMFWWLMLA